MAQACAWSVALVGLEGRIVEVEADIGAGLPRTVLVGLADTALSEARDRCKAAVGNSGHTWPASLLTINLSPATLPKTGSHYDLAIVAAVLAAAEVIPRVELVRTVLLGELGLDGRVTVVFCEVKCRSGLGFGDPLEAITWAKLRRLRSLAAEWMSAHQVSAAAIRLDAVGVLLQRGQAPRLTHVRAVG